MRGHFIKQSRVLAGLIIIGLLGCASPNKDPLSLAGENRDEIKSLLNYYKIPDDTIKFNSAKFLVKNMPHHYTILWSDHKDGSVETFIPINYISKQKVRDAMDSLGVVYRIKGVKKDIEKLPCDYLVSRIEHSYHTLSAFDDAEFAQRILQEFVLPYRVANEKIEDWWTPLHARLKPLFDQKKLTDISRATAIVDSAMRTWFKYYARYAYFQPEMNYTEAMLYEGGLCNHCADFLLMGLRAMGIPSTKDYARLWGNTSGGHIWNAVLLETQQWKPFNFGEYRKEFLLCYQPPKVFRSTFSLNSEIVDEVKRGKNIPAFLLSPLFTDVTNQYVSAVDVRLQGYDFKDDELPLLAVWNRNAWQPVWYGLSENNHVIFHEMASDLVYLPQVFREGKYKNLGEPIWIKHDGTHVFCEPDSSRLISIDGLVAWKYNRMREIINLTKLKSYNLLIWDKEWRIIGKAIPHLKETETTKTANHHSKDKKIKPGANSPEYFLKFDNIPSNGLYRLDDEDQRPFVVAEGKIIYL